MFGSVTPNCEQNSEFLSHQELCARQGSLLITINCGGHIGKVDQSDNFEIKWMFMDILGHTCLQVP